MKRIIKKATHYIEVSNIINKDILYWNNEYGFVKIGGKYGVTVTSRTNAYKAAKMLKWLGASWLRFKVRPENNLKSVFDKLSKNVHKKQR